MLTAKLIGVDGSVVYGNGECGDLIVMNSLCSVASVDFGNKDMQYSIVGMTNESEGKVVEVKINLVVNS